jgi:hypothetical protein
MTEGDALSEPNCRTLVSVLIYRHKGHSTRYGTVKLDRKFLVGGNPMLLAGGEGIIPPRPLYCTEGRVSYALTAG